jgi:GDP-L-fucose synthase
VTIKELAEMVRGVVGYAGTIEFDNTKPDGTPRKLMDVTRLHTMGWLASTGLKAGLASTYADFFNTVPTCQRRLSNAPTPSRRSPCH